MTAQNRTGKHEMSPAIVNPAKEMDVIWECRLKKNIVKVPKCKRLEQIWNRPVKLVEDSQGNKKR